MLGLGAGVTTFLGSNAVASSAFLDLELKQSARILATLSRAPAAPVTTTFELQSGTTIGLPVSVANTTPFTCNNPALTAGPDSGINDNCRWPISVPSWTGTDDGVFFDTITLKALNGVLLARGRRRRHRGRTVTDDHPERVDFRDRRGNSSAAAALTRTRPRSATSRRSRSTASATSGTTSCAPVPYSLSKRGQRAAQFLKPLDAQTSAQFLWDLKWKSPAERRDDRSFPT